MTNNRRTKSIFKILISQLSVALFVTLLALSILFYAEGYRFNYKNFKIFKTGVLAVSCYPKDATVKLNSRIKSDKTPYSVNLLPGYYNVELSKPGFVTWSQTVRVESEMVENFKSTVLFREKPEIATLTDQKLINSLDSPIDSLAIGNKSGIYHSDYEIWLNNDLVTRFSEPILKAIWYADKQHIVYQQGDQIRVIEITGTNDTLLVDLNSSTTTNFIINDKGDELFYKDGSEYKVATIR